MSAIEQYPEWADVAPDADPDSQPFWDGLERGELVVPRCGACQRLIYPAIATCPHCGAGSEDRHQQRLPSTGTVYSWTTVHIALDPAFTGETPYTVAAVDFDPDVRVLGRFLDDPAGLSGDLKVDLVAYRTGGAALPGFRSSADGADVV